MNTTEPSEPSEHTGVPPAPAPTVIAGGPLDARVVEISDSAAAELERRVAAGSGGGNRFVWFMAGFLAALVAGVIASIAFLAVSDDDDDGDIRLDVPEVDVDVTP